VGSGATVSPGDNSIGTLSVGGNITFLGGSTYVVDANATSSDRIHATGTATINSGSTLKLGQASGLTALQTYTVLTADSGVTGSFAAPSSTYAFLDPTLTYDAKDVLLTLKRNDTTFASAGQTSNQSAVGAAVESLGSGNALYNAVANLDTGQV